MSAQIPEAVIRDTVAAVFTDAAYNRTTLLQRIGAWLLEVLKAALEWLPVTRAPSWLFWVVVILVGAFVAAVIGRAIYGTFWGFRLARTVTSVHGARAATDAFRVARDSAARGDFTAAAHALYAALLARIAGQSDIEIHESKTIGDYTRDLRVRAPGLLPPFREFARTYETVIYGLGSCDQIRYERLLGLAGPLIEAGG
jgi:hypothetical protein